MNFGLENDIIESIRSTILSNNRVERIFIYGSRAKGTYKNGSDIDLVLEGEKLTFEDLSEIEVQLDDLLLPYKIDLSTLKGVTYHELKDHIARVGIEFKT